jgi:hypothetical protein
MTAAVVLTVQRADVDLICRRCGQVIRRGRRVVLLAGAGAVHVRCLIVRQADDINQEPGNVSSNR